MKVLLLAAGFGLVLGLAGCGGSSEEEAATVMPAVVGQQLDVAKTAIESAGFEEEVEVSGGGTFGVVDESNWTVCEQSPDAGQPISAAPTLTVDRSCEDGAAESTTTEVEPTESTEPPPTTAAEAEEILTAATNADLAALLAGPDCGGAVESFASTYAGRTIEFDGSIAAMNNHGDYDTRFDILVVPGDGGQSTVGPNFQFRDVNIVSDLRLTGSNIPDTIGVGQNLHVIAQVEGYDSNSCLFLLKPVSTGIR